MRFLLLIYADEGAEATMSEAEMGAILQKHMDFATEAAAAGMALSGERLQPTSTATTLRARGGKVEVHDGPFTETKEALGGYYIIDVAGLDEAIAWARKLPQYGSIEIRPIWEMGA